MTLFTNFKSLGKSLYTVLFTESENYLQTMTIEYGLI